MIHAFIVLLICTQIAWSAVPYLALQDALAMGKSQSVELRMQNSQKKLSNLQVENALAGLLPTLTLQSDASRTDLPFTQYRDQTTIRNTLALQWIVFDGMSTRTSIEIARKSADVNTAKNAATTLQLLTQISMAYWDVARQQSLTNLRIINLERSQELLRIATAKHQLGATSLLDVRQAELDRNADSSAILRQNLAFRQAERALNSLLERDLELEFRVDSLAFLDTTLSLSILRTSLEENNPNLHAARFNEQSFEASIRLAKSSWYPNVAVYSKFTALNTIPDETPPSLLYSPSALWGVQLDWKLYEGGRTRVRVASAQESREFARYTTQQVRANLEKTLALSWANYQQSVQMWQMELRNASLADQTFQLALEQFKLGAISALEMRRLQESYTEAVSRATMARFDAKQAEIAVMALVGQ